MSNKMSRLENNNKEWKSMKIMFGEEVCGLCSDSFEGSGAECQTFMEVFFGNGQKNGNKGMGVDDSIHHGSPIGRRLDESINSKYKISDFKIQTSNQCSSGFEIDRNGDFVLEIGNCNGSGKNLPQPLDISQISAQELYNETVESRIFRTDPKNTSLRIIQHVVESSSEGTISYIPKQNEKISWDNLFSCKFSEHVEASDHRMCSKKNNLIEPVRFSISLERSLPVALVTERIHSVENSFVIEKIEEKSTERNGDLSTDLLLIGNLGVGSGTCSDEMVPIFQQKSESKDLVEENLAFVPTDVTIKNKGSSFKKTKFKGLMANGDISVNNSLADADLDNNCKPLLSTPVAVDGNTKLRRLLRWHANRIIMTAGYTLKTRERNSCSRSRVDSIYTSPDGKRRLNTLPRAWNACGVDFAIDEIDILHSRNKQWVNVDDFWMEVSDTLDSIEKEMQRSGSSFPLARQWKILDPYVTLVFIKQMVGMLRQGMVVSVKPQDASQSDCPALSGNHTGAISPPRETKINTQNDNFYSQEMRNVIVHDATTIEWCHREKWSTIEECVVPSTDFVAQSCIDSCIHSDSNFFDVPLIYGNVNITFSTPENDDMYLPISTKENFKREAVGYGKKFKTVKKKKKKVLSAGKNRSFNNLYKKNSSVSFVELDTLRLGMDFSRSQFKDATSIDGQYLSIPSPSEEAFQRNVSCVQDSAQEAFQRNVSCVQDSAFSDLQSVSLDFNAEVARNGIQNEIGETLQENLASSFSKERFAYLPQEITFKERYNNENFKRSNNSLTTPSDDATGKTLESLSSIVAPSNGVIHFHLNDKFKEEYYSKNPMSGKLRKKFKKPSKKLSQQHFPIKHHRRPNKGNLYDESTTNNLKTPSFSCYSQLPFTEKHVKTVNEIICPRAEDTNTQSGRTAVQPQRKYGRKRVKVCSLADDDLLIAAIIKNKKLDLTNTDLRPKHKKCQLVSLGKNKNQKRRCKLLLRNPGKGSFHFNDVRPSLLRPRTVLSWLIYTGVLCLRDVLQYRSPKDNTLIKDCLITREGCLCKCCNKMLSVSEFKVHAGFTVQKPCSNLFLESGKSFILCQIQAWSAEYKSRRWFVQEVKCNEENDDSDDTCGRCGDGGELVCCDNCPSTFHLSCLSTQELPEGNWYCPSCSCKLCGEVVNEEASSSLAILKCPQCKHKCHEACVKEQGLHADDGSDVWFCGKDCQTLYPGLLSRVGISHQIPGGLSWTILRSIHGGLKFNSAQQFALMAECNTKLAVALTILEECFLPMVDPRTGINIIPHVLYSLGSKFTRLNFEGFYTAILEKGDEIVCVACIRIHGVTVAEMPLIATCSEYRRQGMCRKLMNAILEMLKSSKVQTLVISAIPILVETWISGFGFTVIDDNQKELLSSIDLMSFPGTILLKMTVCDGTEVAEDKIAYFDRFLPLELHQNTETNEPESIDLSELEQEGNLQKHHSLLSFDNQLLSTLKETDHASRQYDNSSCNNPRNESFSLIGEKTEKTDDDILSFRTEIDTASHMRNGLKQTTFSDKCEEHLSKGFPSGELDKYSFKRLSEKEYTVNISSSYDLTDFVKEKSHDNCVEKLSFGKK